SYTASTLCRVTQHNVDRRILDGYGWSASQGIRPASAGMERGDGMGLEHVDIVIVGAGLSGIGAACHLRRECPEKSFTILEARDAIGGPWDQFGYPCIRSPPDLSTLC